MFTFFFRFLLYCKIRHHIRRRKWHILIRKLYFWFSIDFFKIKQKTHFIKKMLRLKFVDFFPVKNEWVILCILNEGTLFKLLKENYVGDHTAHTEILLATWLISSLDTKISLRWRLKVENRREAKRRVSPLSESRPSLVHKLKMRARFRKA